MDRFNKATKKLSAVRKFMLKEESSSEEEEEEEEEEVSENELAMYRDALLEVNNLIKEQLTEMQD